MRTLYASDRSRASEHAIFAWRELTIPAERVATHVQRAAENVAGRLSLIAPAPLGRSTAMPIELGLHPSHERANWRIELRVLTDGERFSFFDGEIRIHGLPHQRSQVLLLGRFSIPHELYAHVAENVMHDIAEDNVIRAFETLLLEVESAAAAPADLLGHPHRRRH